MGLTVWFVLGCLSAFYLGAMFAWWGDGRQDLKRWKMAVQAIACFKNGHGECVFVLLETLRDSLARTSWKEHKKP